MLCFCNFFSKDDQKPKTKNGMNEIHNTKTLTLCVWNSMCIICMFLFYLNLWSLFFCVFFFLLKNAVVLKKATVSQCFFPFLSIHSDAFLPWWFWKYICISFGIFFTKKNFCFFLMEVPHYGRKSLILSKNDFIFFLFKSLMYDLVWSFFWVTNDKNPT